jgi:hypothetical protein
LDDGIASLFAAREAEKNDSGDQIDTKVSQTMIDGAAIRR